MAAVGDQLRQHLAEDQASLVTVARALGQGPFAARAAGFDETNRFPSENYDDLRSAGLLALTVPKEYGGIGADPVAYVAVLVEISKGCASTGLTFNMHCAIVDFLSQIASPAQQRRYFGEIVEEGAILASITSEPASSFRDVFKVKTAIDRDGDGYRLRGQKAWCSLSTAARYYFTWSRLTGSKDLAEGLLNLMVPAGRDGVEIQDDWDTLGMRATASNSIHFESVRIEPDEVIGAPGILLTKDLSFWSVGYTAVYTGIAEAAYDYCLDYARERLSAVAPGSAQAVRIERQIGEMAMTLESARRSTETLARMRDRLGRTELTFMLNQAKFLATEAACTISQQGMRLLGGSSIKRALPMQRYLRDAQAGPVMPPANDRCIETVGRIALGLEAKTLEFS
ncbi:MAG: acyl-CoA/acyl-ACP dehydrogenase [Alphaproteobacteria bacterium]|nr:acyl-CoA/acyl-ACP dehydrogenase [Alphaproteobacteria bacterium]